jgi:hypothetical protein
MTFEINIKANVDRFQRELSAVAYRQLPFATAQALTAIARRVTEAEKLNEEKVLDRPKPFTQNAIGVIPARKERQTAVVFMKDITAHYLEPYEFGGLNVLNSRALLKPVDAKRDLDQFGNLPRTFLKNLKGRSDIFIGAVQTKNGTVNGVWQRSMDEGTTAVPVARLTRNGKLRMGKTRKGINTSGKLKLLVKFDDAHRVNQHLDWFGVASRTVAKYFNREMGRALAKAIASAR